MTHYDVQITTDLEECIVVQIYASSEAEAEMTAISMVEEALVNTRSTNVIDCFVLYYSCIQTKSGKEKLFQLFLSKYSVIPAKMINFTSKMQL